MAFKRLGLDQIIALVNIVCFIVNIVPFIANLIQNKDMIINKNNDDNEDQVQTESANTNPTRQLWDNTINKLEKRKETEESQKAKDKIDKCINKMRKLEEKK